jgi:hypothetical protein
VTPLVTATAAILQRFHAPAAGAVITQRARRADAAPERLEYRPSSTFEAVLVPSR